jgi:hypothetical protein
LPFADDFAFSPSDAVVSTTISKHDDDDDTYESAHVSAYLYILPFSISLWIFAISSGLKFTNQFSHTFFSLSGRHVN